MWVVEGGMIRGFVVFVRIEIAIGIVNASAVRLGGGSALSTG